MRVLLTAVLLALVAFGQMGMPLLGWVCDRAGALRPVHGAAGAFVLGEAVANDVVQASFDGRKGVATPGAGEAGFGFNARGERVDEAEVAAVDAHAEGRTLVLERRAVRLEVPEEIERIDHLGEGWLAVRTANAIWAVRTDEGKEQIFRLPEAEAAQP